MLTFSLGTWRPCWCTLQKPKYSTYMHEFIVSHFPLMERIKREFCMKPLTLLGRLFPGISYFSHVILIMKSMEDLLLREFAMVFWVFVTKRRWQYLGRSHGSFICEENLEAWNDDHRFHILILDFLSVSRFHYWLSLLLLIFLLIQRARIVICFLKFYGKKQWQCSMNLER